MAQLLSFGATVALVNGSYHQAFDLCLWASGEYGWYNRNTGYNPYMTEGKKTVSYEIWEQLGHQVPDVVVSVGTDASSAAYTKVSWTFSDWDGSTVFPG